MRITKRQISIAVIVAWVVFLVMALYLPANTYQGFLFPKASVDTPKAGLTQTIQFGSSPPVTFTYQANLTTYGAWSVGNEINVVIRIWNVSIPYPNFLKDYSCVTFVNGAYQANTPFKLTYIGNDSYETSGTMSPGPETGPVWLTIQPAQNFTLTGQNIRSVETYPFLGFSATTQSDTVTMIFNENLFKSVVILASFSILLLHPVFEDIVVKEDDRNGMSKKKKGTEGPSK